MQGHILIVEDEEAIAAFVQTALEREGFTTQWVGNGPSALSAIQVSQPDLIVLDLMLPGMDGLQVCQKVRQREHYIPIIMLTARAAVYLNDTPVAFFEGRDFDKSGQTVTSANPWGKPCVSSTTSSSGT